MTLGVSGSIGGEIASLGSLGALLRLFFLVFFCPSSPLISFSALPFSVSSVNAPKAPANGIAAPLRSCVSSASEGSVNFTIFADCGMESDGGMYG
jgi:hypothetical protein